MIDQLAVLTERDLASAPTSLIIETSARLEELAEQAKRIRADEIFELLHRD